MSKNSLETELKTKNEKYSTRIAPARPENILQSQENAIFLFKESSNAVND